MQEYCSIFNKKNWNGYNICKWYIFRKVRTCREIFKGMCRIHILLDDGITVKQTRHIFGLWLARVLNVCSYLCATRSTNKKKTRTILFMSDVSLLQSICQTFHLLFYAYFAFFCRYDAYPFITKAETMLILNLLLYSTFAVTVNI